MSLPRTHDYLHSQQFSAETVLFQCEVPTCGGFARLLEPHPMCSGTSAHPHRDAHMDVVEDHGQEPTSGLIVDGEAM